MCSAPSPPSLLTALALCTALAWPMEGQASRKDPQRTLPAWGQAGVLSLERLQADVATQVPGRLVTAELDEDAGQPVYEIRWLLADGRVLEIEIDARTGQWLGLQGARLETLWRKGLPSPARPSR